jgi:hypothetical protein
MGALTQTLGDLLLKTSEEAQAALEKPALNEVRSQITVRANMDWPTMSGACAQALQTSLDIKLIDVLVGGWTKLVKLQAYLDHDRYPPSEICPFPLVEHTIRSVHHPCVEVLVDEVQIEPTITFNLEFTLNLEGIVLDIQGGRIIAIRTGSFAGGGTLKYASIILCEVETPKYEIPGIIVLDEGIAIPRLS